ncbi:PASTA domain-containing protein [Corynebacterium amycolatum]|uniref:PASTA domain-containing protein n=1 Tax=Corynebacterium TaxID=1716 RepID=UPI00065F91EE|nr:MULTISPECIES: PASTA domain-containing protein [Corynebacterium]MCQ9172775.1 PASTA domain-containing protein [Corynebacterium amycolatum]
MVRRGNNRDGSQHDGRDNSYGRDSSSSYGDDSATRYIPRDGGYRGYNPDADFAGEQPTEYFGGDSSETQFLQRGDETRFDDSRGAGAGAGAGAQGGGAQGSGQYWAPLSEEERGYGQASQQAGQTQQYAAGGAGGYADPNNGDNRGNDDSKKGWGKTVAIVAIAAMVAVVALVALVLSFTSGTEDNKDNTAAPTQETSSSPTPTTTSPEETTTSPLDRVDPSGTINDTRERLEQELDQLRESPPAIPGPGERSSGWGTIPQGVVGKSPASVEVELRTNGYQNVTVVDAEGNPTNSVAAIMGKVASIDPPEGQMAETSTPVTIYLQ